MKTARLSPINHQRARCSRFSVALLPPPSPRPRVSASPRLPVAPPVLLLSTIKHRLSTIFLLLLLVIPASAQVKLAVIDLGKVFDKYYKTQAASAKIKERVADMDKELKALRTQYEKATEDYKKALDEANNQAVSSEEREKRKKAAETKFREIQELEQSVAQFRTQANTTIEEQKRRMVENILGEIRAVINTKAKAAGYSLVLDTSGDSLRGAPVVIYSNGENDITDAVLALLNANAPPDRLKPDEKK